MLALTMPNASIQATPMRGMFVLTGTVAAPEDVAEANRLVQAFVGEGTQVISRLKSAKPLQVMLQVKIAEVSRSHIRDIGVNLQAADPTSGFQFFGIRGRDLVDDADTALSSGGTSISLLGNLLGPNVGAAIALTENICLVMLLE